MVKGLKTKIIKTLWKYGLNPKTFYILVYEDGSKSYYWDSERYSRNFIDTNDFWFKFYWDFVRTPIAREDKYSAPSDIYELRIEKYNPRTGKMVKYWSSKE